MLDLKSMPPLFDFFEDAMIAATFAYQAIETFANAPALSRTCPRGDASRFRGRRRRGSTDVAELQRGISTDEKVATGSPHDHRPCAHQVLKALAGFRHLGTSTRRDHTSEESRPFCAWGQCGS